MARFFSKPITDPKTGRVYFIDISIDRIAALRESLSIDVVARQVPVAGEPGQQVTATLIVDLPNQELIIEIEGEEVSRIAFAGPDANDAEMSERVADEAWEMVRDNLMQEGGPDLADMAEDAIQAVPVFDPVLGCLLKGGISATVGQVIRCHRTIQRAPMGYEEGLPGKLRQLAKCLGKNAWGMLARAGWRAARCMATLGTG